MAVIQNFSRMKKIYMWPPFDKNMEKSRKVWMRVEMVGPDQYSTTSQNIEDFPDRFSYTADQIYAKVDELNVKLGKARSFDPDDPKKKNP
jgi:hypothetical protein